MNPKERKVTWGWGRLLIRFIHQGAELSFQLILGLSAAETMRIKRSAYKIDFPLNSLTCTHVQHSNQWEHISPKIMTKWQKGQKDKIVIIYSWKVVRLKEWLGIRWSMEQHCTLLLWSFPFEVFNFDTLAMII